MPRKRKSSSAQALLVRLESYGQQIRGSSPVRSLALIRQEEGARLERTGSSDPELFRAMSFAHARVAAVSSLQEKRGQVLAFTPPASRTPSSVQEPVVSNDQDAESETTNADEEETDVSAALGAAAIGAAAVGAAAVSMAGADPEDELQEVPEELDLGVMLDDESVDDDDTAPSDTHEPMAVSLSGQSIDETGLEDEDLESYDLLGDQSMNQDASIDTEIEIEIDAGMLDEVSIDDLADELPPESVDAALLSSLNDSIDQSASATERDTNSWEVEEIPDNIPDAVAGDEDATEIVDEAEVSASLDEVTTTDDFKAGELTDEVGHAILPTIKDKTSASAVAAAAVHLSADGSARAVSPTLADPFGEAEVVELEDAGEEYDDVEAPEDGGFVVDVESADEWEYEDDEPSAGLNLTEDDKYGVDNDGNIELSADDVSEVEELDQEKVEDLMDQAANNLEEGDLTSATTAFTDLLEMDPNNLDAYLGRGRCHLDLGDYAAAMSDFQKAEDIDPEGPEPLVAMGELFFARKEYSRAIEFFDSAIELDSNHAMARCRRGISYYYKKTYRQAFLDLQKAYTLDPEIPNIRKYVQMAIKKLEKSGEK